MKDNRTCSTCAHWSLVLEICLNSEIWSEMAYTRRGSSTACSKYEPIKEKEE